MATIQVRDLSAQAHAVIRGRARASGQSIQMYMRDQIERWAAEPTDDELFSEAEDHVRAAGADVEVEALLGDLAADRR
ncbi:MAG: antitoxin [Acidimicrobiia bacterium]|nr:antitoxin [Acidimicrobiia bacterium]